MQKQTGSYTRYFKVKGDTGVLMQNIRFSITASIPAETLLSSESAESAPPHWPHMPEGRKRHGDGCDPSITTAVQPTDTMLVKMTECRGSDGLHPVSYHCFRAVTPHQVWSIFCPSVSLSEQSGLGMSCCLRQIPCNCDDNGSFYTLTIYVVFWTIWTAVGFVRLLSSWQIGMAAVKYVAPQNTQTVESQIR